MSEPTSKKRKFWQYHLLTAVLLTLLAGLFLFANFRKENISIHLEYEKQTLIFVKQGWPYRFVSGIPPNVNFSATIFHEENFERAKRHQQSLELLFDLMEQRSSSTKLFVEDISICIASLLAMGLIFEYLICRLECRKP